MGACQLTTTRSLSSSQMAPLPMYQRSSAASMRPKAMASSGSASPSLLTRLRSSMAALGLAASQGACHARLLPVAQGEGPVE